MFYRLGYLLIFPGRITTPTSFALSITLLGGGDPGKAMGPEIIIHMLKGVWLDWFLRSGSLQ
jgi:hypothetical protein